MNSSDQDKVWDYYQNEQPETFSGGLGRLSFLAKMVRNQKVLNIGVGNGYFEENALKYGADVYSLDPSDRAIERLCNRLGLGDKAKVGYSQEIPYPSEYFDVVVISEVLEHLGEDDLLATLKEIHRVLKPSGRIIGTVPACDDLLNQMVVCPHCGKLFHRWGHLQSFDIERLTVLLSLNFIIEKIYKRPFITWSALNWKGKISATAIFFLWCIGIHSSYENIVFVVVKR